MDELERLYQAAATAWEDLHAHRLTGAVLMGLSQSDPVLVAYKQAAATFREAQFALYHAIRRHDDDPWAAYNEASAAYEHAGAIYDKALRI